MPFGVDDGVDARIADKHVDLPDDDPGYHLGRHGEGHPVYRLALLDPELGCDAKTFFAKALDVYVRQGHKADLAIADATHF